METPSLPRSAETETRHPSPADPGFCPGEDIGEESTPQIPEEIVDPPPGT